MSIYEIQKGIREIAEQYLEENVNQILEGNLAFLDSDDKIPEVVDKCLISLRPSIDQYLKTYTDATSDKSIKLLQYTSRNFTTLLIEVIENQITKMKSKN
jgi:hypothetical protein